MKRTLRLLLLAIVAFATSAATCNWCPSSVPAPSAILLAVRDQSEASLSTAEGTQIAHTASTILQTKDAAADVACQVTLEVESQDRLEGVPAVIDTEFDFKALFADVATPAQSGAVPIRNVRVVSELRWCGADETSLAGCAIGLNIAITRRGSDREGVLWAHEVGHTKGLGHRDGPDDWPAVMFPKILPDHFELTAGECTLYRQ